MRGRLIPLLVCVILVGTATTVALAQVGSPSPARAAAVRASGSFEISSSGEGQPIFAAAGFAPGGSVSGTVGIEDSGSVPVTLKLRRGELTDASGIGGGILSSRLQLTVADITEPAQPQTIYAGPLDSMPEQEAGELTPGQTRTYRFTASLPDGASSLQNALQSASTTVAYAWVAEEASGEEGPPTEAPAAAETPSGGSENRGASTGGGIQGAGPGAGAVLELTVPKIASTINGGRFLTYVDCDAACRIFVRGKLWASAQGHRRVAKISFTVKRPYSPGSRKMRIPVPRSIRNWLRHMPGPAKLRARLRFIALGTAGGRDVVQKNVRLRVRHHH